MLVPFKNKHHLIYLLGGTAWVWTRYSYEVYASILQIQLSKLSKVLEKPD